MPLCPSAVLLWQKSNASAGRCFFLGAGWRGNSDLKVSLAIEYSLFLKEVLRRVPLVDLYEFLKNSSLDCNLEKIP